MSPHTPTDTPAAFQQSPKGPKKNGSAKGKGKPNAKAAGPPQEVSTSNGAADKPDNPGDYWTPQGEDVGEFVERLGALSPIPDHDGTECLKWDDTLWSHADHFKVHLTCIVLYCLASPWAVFSQVI